MREIGGMFSFLTTVFYGVIIVFVYHEWTNSITKEIVDEEIKNKHKNEFSTDEDQQVLDIIDKIKDRCSYKGIYKLNDEVINV